MDKDEARDAPKTDVDADIGEKLHRTHKQLDAADRGLVEITDLIDEVVEREFEEAGVRTITSLRNGSVTIQLPIDCIASRFNRYVAITELGDLEVRPYEQTDYGIRRLGEIKSGPAIMETLKAMQRDYPNAPHSDASDRRSYFNGFDGT